MLGTAGETVQSVHSTRTTIWRMVRAGCFPAPIQLSPARRGWRESAIEAWLSERERRPIRAREYFGRPVITPPPVASPMRHYSPAKIHSRVDLGSDGWLYCSTHRGSTRVTTDEYHYQGDWIIREGSAPEARARW